MIHLKVKKKRFCLSRLKEKITLHGIAPLKGVEKQSVQLQNKRHVPWIITFWKPVFTTEDLSNVPQLDCSIHPSIQNPTFTIHGIQLLLDPVKAPGPYKVSKLCANAVAPLLQIIIPIFRTCCSSSSLL